jgi:hypothetical protein
MPSKNENIDVILSKLLNQPIDDESQVLTIITEAILNKSIDPKLVSQAVRQVINQYENKLKVFTIGVAQLQLKRILNLIEILDNMDDQLKNSSKTTLMEDKDFIRMYATVQTSMVQALTFIKEASTTQLDIDKDKVELSGSGIVIEEEPAIKLLNANQRDRVRKVIEVIESIEREGKCESI